MIKNLYQELKSAADQNEAAAIITRLRKEELFEPLMNEFSDWWPVCKYILDAYSIESEFIEIGEDWQEKKKQIAIQNGLGALGEEQLRDILSMKTPGIWKTVDNYLQYQGGREFRHLTVLKQLYERMLSSTFDNEVSYDQQYQNSVYAKNIWKEIGEYEQAVWSKFTEQFKRVYTDANIVINKKKKSTSGTSLNLESSDLIHT